jgi:alpha-N-arabinofuranosidase
MPPHPGAAINPAMFGIFFEDINFGADGGLYPELVKNRSFEFQEPLTGWHEVLGFGPKGIDSPKGELGIHTESPLNPSNPHYLHVPRLRTRLLLLQHRISRHGHRERR